MSLLENKTTIKGTLYDIYQACYMAYGKEKAISIIESLLDVLGLLIEVMADKPLKLPANVIKIPFDGNKQYRVFSLKEVLPDGTQKVFYRINNKGKKTDFYYEEFVNDKWIYRDEIPHDAFVKYVGDVKTIV